MKIEIVIYICCLFMRNTPYAIEHFDYYLSSPIVLQDNYYAIYHTSGEWNYHVALYDKEGKIVYVAEHPRTFPKIEYISDNLMRIHHGIGTGAWEEQYYDITSQKISKPFLNPVLSEKGLVVYYQYSGGGYEFTLIAADMFSNKIYNEFEVSDLPETLFPFSFTEDISLSDDDILTVTYYTDLDRADSKTIALQIDR